MFATVRLMTGTSCFCIYVIYIYILYIVVACKQHNAFGHERKRRRNHAWPDVDLISFDAISSLWRTLHFLSCSPCEMLVSFLSHNNFSIDACHTCSFNNCVAVADGYFHCLFRSRWWFRRFRPKFEAQRRLSKHLVDLELLDKHNGFETNRGNM